MSITRLPSLALGTALVLLFGCTTSDVMRLDGVSRPATLPANVEVFVEEPQRPYKAIAIIEISDDGNDMGLEYLKNEMVREAAKLGADAVIIGARGSKNQGTTFIPIGDQVHAFESTAETISGKAIVWQ